MRRLVCGWILACLLVPAAAFPWGNEGHRIASLVAERNMDPAVKAKVRDLLNGQTLADVCVLPDSWKKTTMPETSAWHFVDIPTDAEAYDAARDCKQDDCVLPHLDHFVQVLADQNASRADRKQALIFVVHFVEDLHQPLHSASRFTVQPDGSEKDDRGGNDVKVTFFGKQMNLHSLWDTAMITRELDGEADYASYLLDDVLGNRSPDDLNGGTPVEWVNEAHEQAVEHAYHLPKAGKNGVYKLGDNYYRANGGFVDEQLLLSGLRLRKVIEDALK